MQKCFNVSVEIAAFVCKISNVSNCQQIREFISGLKEEGRHICLFLENICLKLLLLLCSILRFPKLKIFFIIVAIAFLQHIVLQCFPFALKTFFYNFTVAYTEWSLNLSCDCELKELGWFCFKLREKMHSRNSFEFR